MTTRENKGNEKSGAKSNDVRAMRAQTPHAARQGDTPKTKPTTESGAETSQAETSQAETSQAETSQAETSQAETRQAERLQKLLSRAGVASRRAAENLIAQGRVSVNGHVVTELGAKADPLRDKIIADGKPVVFSDAAKTVVLLHKPRGTVTTKSDPEGRATVLDLLPKKLAHLNPVGRLDFNTAGVLLLTDDGDLLHLLTHPSHGVEKIYHARVGGKVSPETIRKIEAGIFIEDGERKFKTAPCRARVCAQTENNALVEIVLREGRNRQVRKMLEAVGHRVSSLRRVKFANLELEEMPAGAYRILLPGEVHALRKIAEKSIQKKPRATRSTPAAKRAKKTVAKKPVAKKPVAKKSPAKPPVTLGERIRREWK
jgi:pseudouridine synthase